MSADSVALQTDGRVVVGGTSGDYGATALTLARYYVTGTLDTGFGNNGIVTAAVASSHLYGESVAVQTDTRIVAAGTAWTASYDFVVARYDAPRPRPRERHRPVDGSC